MGQLSHLCSHLNISSKYKLIISRPQLITKGNASSKYNHHTHLLHLRTKVASPSSGTLNKNTRYIVFRKQTHQETKMHEPGRGRSGLPQMSGRGSGLPCTSGHSRDGTSVSSRWRWRCGEERCSVRESVRCC